MKTTVKLLANGIKNNGDYIRCLYTEKNGSILITARDYKNLPKELGNVTNDSDMITDYFENDRVLITPTNKYYKAAKEAYKKARINDAKKHIKYLEKMSAKYTTIDYSSEIEAAKKTLINLLNVA